VICKSGKTYYTAVEKDFTFLVNDSFTEFKVSDDKTENIVHMGIGKKFGVFVTNKGKLWVCGQNF
jgi:alpha-tubulin suppressor-like RCC1 family protein